MKAIAGSSVLTVVIILATPSTVSADGYKFGYDGRVVPEHEQRGLIDWADGVEALHVAIRAEPTADANAWVIPVRARPEEVRAEPVDEFPVVTHYQTLVARARHQLQSLAAGTAILDSGGLLCPFLMGGCASSGAPATEAARIERLGMVVTVVSAQSRSAIEQYLDRQGVTRSAVDLSPLEPYFQSEGFSLVCGWMAKREQPVTANGLKIGFPSPTIWFPLQPTRVYHNEVKTVVFVRGFVKPAKGCELPQLTCEYVFGKVESKGVSQSFAAPLIGNLDHYYYGGLSDEITRVTLAGDAQRWDRDLDLVPGTSAKGAVALAVYNTSGAFGGYFPFVWIAGVGAVLGLFLPTVAIPKKERKPIDRLGGALVGAAIMLSLGVMLVVYISWCRALKLGGRSVYPDPWSLITVAGFTALHFVIAGGSCLALAAWLGAGG
jgi:hypothetical protein